MNELDACHVSPLSMLYSNAPCPPVAVMSIVPSAKPQSVGCVEATFVIEGALGTVNSTGLEVWAVTQLPSIFLTKMLNVPAPSPVKLPLSCQFVPPSIEYSNVAPVAVMTIEPSFVPQFEGSLATTFVIIGWTLSINTTSELG